MQNNQKWEGKIDIRGGRTYVRNPRNPLFRKDILFLREEMSIGETNKDRKVTLFSDIKEIAVDDNGNIYALDFKAREINIFDSYGKYMSSVGRVGQGPGEFQFPWSIYIKGQDSLIVLDYMQRNLLFYTLGGLYNKVIKLNSYGVCSKFALDSSGYVVGEFIIKSGGSKVMRINPTTGESKQIIIKENERIPLLQDISPKIIWCLGSNNQLVWGISDKYEINVCDGRGAVVKKITKPLKLQIIKKGEFESQVKTKFGGKPIPPDFEKELPQYYPAFRNIYLDDEGKFIVETYEKDSRGNKYFDVFDSQGRYLAKVALDFACQVWKRGRLYCVQNDEKGSQIIKRYKAEWIY